MKSKSSSLLKVNHARAAAAITAGIVSLASTSAFAATTTYSSQINALNPLVYYQFDETSGTTAVDSSSGGASLSLDGTNNAGITVNQSSFTQGGTAYAFNEGQVTFGGTLGSLDNWTFEAWVNWDTKTSQSHIFGNDRPGWNDDVLIGIGAEAQVGSSQFGVVQQGAPGSTRDKAGFGMTAGAWHHVAVTGNTALGTLTTYIDGVQVAQDASLVNDATLGNNAWTLGSSEAAFGNNRDYKGLLDEVAIYGSVLSDAQIASNYALGISPIPEPSSTALLGLGGLALIMRRRR